MLFPFLQKLIAITENVALPKKKSYFKAILSQIKFGTYGHTSSNLIIQVMSDDGIIWPFPRF